jgi:hypothetical protein
VVGEASERSHWVVVAEEFARIQGSGLPVRPNYTWCVLHAASVASRTGVPEISVIEFGVAGGNGLVALEAVANEAARTLGVGIRVFGFDTGKGLPASRDPRDAPFLMEQGDFPMDEDALRARLEHAVLVLGDVDSTVPRFLESEPAPVGFISFDLDYYSSTRDALRLLDGDHAAFLPRVLCYFDDIHCYPWGDSNGARLAIREFNAERQQRKMDALHGMRYLMGSDHREERWVEALYLAHLFDHPRYSDFEGTHLVRRLDLS